MPVMYNSSVSLHTENTRCLHYKDQPVKVVMEFIIYCENHAQGLNMLCVRISQLLNFTATGRLLDFKQFIYIG
jgi:hypothetical protein